ncbi:MAG: hypothetical protein U1F76_06275 [Candidatus Competibacteraceae bacterium]
MAENAAPPDYQPLWLRRLSAPPGIIDTRAAHRRYDRTTAWIARHVGRVGKLLARYAVADLDIASGHLLLARMLSAALPTDTAATATTSPSPGNSHIEPDERIAHAPSGPEGRSPSPLATRLQRRLDTVGVVNPRPSRVIERTTLDSALYMRLSARANPVPPQLLGTSPIIRPIATSATGPVDRRAGGDESLVTRGEGGTDAGAAPVAIGLPNEAPVPTPPVTTIASESSVVATQTTQRSDVTESLARKVATAPSVADVTAADAVPHTAELAPRAASPAVGDGLILARPPVDTPGDADAYPPPATATAPEASASDALPVISTPLPLVTLARRVDRREAGATAAVEVGRNKRSDSGAFPATGALPETAGVAALFRPTELSSPPDRTVGVTHPTERGEASPSLAREVATAPSVADVTAADAVPHTAELAPRAASPAVGDGLILARPPVDTPGDADAYPPPATATAPEASASDALPVISTPLPLVTLARRVDRREAGATAAVEVGRNKRSDSGAFPATGALPETAGVAALFRPTELSSPPDRTVGVTHPTERGEASPSLAREVATAPSVADVTAADAVPHTAELAPRAASPAVGDGLILARPPVDTPGDADAYPPPATATAPEASASDALPVISTPLPLVTLARRVDRREAGATAAVEVGRNKRSDSGAFPATGALPETAGVAALFRPTELSSPPDRTVGVTHPTERGEASPSLARKVATAPSVADVTAADAVPHTAELAPRAASSAVGDGLILARPPVDTPGDADAYPPPATATAPEASASDALPVISTPLPLVTLARRVDRREAGATAADTAHKATLALSPLDAAVPYSAPQDSLTRPENVLHPALTANDPSQVAPALTTPAAMPMVTRMASVPALTTPAAMPMVARMASAPRAPQPLARTSEIAAEAPSVAPTLVWRVVDAQESRAIPRSLGSTAEVAIMRTASTGANDGASSPAASAVDAGAPDNTTVIPDAARVALPDLNRLAEQVMRLIVRRIEIERDRRGGKAWL